MISNIMSAMKSIFTKEGALLLATAFGTIYLVNNTMLKDYIKS
jgi:hypothetical protein